MPTELKVLSASVSFIAVPSFRASASLAAKSPSRISGCAIGAFTAVICSDCAIAAAGINSKMPKMRINTPNSGLLLIHILLPQLSLLIFYQIKCHLWQLDTTFYFFELNIIA
jgi:hypothetical protein